MIENFVRLWEERKQLVEDKFKENHPGNYEEIVKEVVTILKTEEYGSIDPSRITEIDHGDYQGTLLYIIASSNYQPSDFWFVKVAYGSCSGCDTLERIRCMRSYSDKKPSEEQVKQYMTLALHIVQGLKELGGEEV